MNALAQRVAALIAAQGPITIAQYMTIAMHDRTHGYYATRRPIGAGGDFITAPEISQMFGELLGLWCVQVWRDQASPKRSRLVELGPGRGTLMADALRAARIAPDFLAAVEVTLIESSPELRQSQRKALENCGVRVSWVEQWQTGLFDCPTFFVANEFFDAMPIRQFVFTAQGWRERMVATDANGGLGFVVSPVMADAAFAAGRRGAPVGGVCEFSDTSTALVEEMAFGIAAHGGGALIVDYGYAQPGYGETLQAVAKHEISQVLEAPGDVDLSAHVDFSALMRSAQSRGAATYGPIAQGAFLAELGIVERAGRLSRASTSLSKSMESDLARLIAPAEMGELFKVLAVLPKHAPKPPGF